MVKSSYFRLQTMACFSKCSSVDITSDLRDMYDRSVNKEPKDASSRTGENRLPSGVHGVQKETVANTQTVPGSRPRHNPPTGTKLHLSLAPLQGKDCPRPLSSSSLASSSSSSSSSPRRDSKKLYLASIESLDDEFSEDCSRRTTRSRDQSPPERVKSKIEIVSSYDRLQSNCSTQSVESVPQLTSGSRDSSLSHTDRVILEIVETERTYVQDLQEIIEGYLLYIPENVGSKVNINSLTDLFCNIEDIYNFNRTFLQDLEMCGLDSVAVARCFFKHSYGFAIYTQYCTNYPRTVSILTDLMRNSETAEVFKERQIALGHNLPLGSYLLKPVQRILRYRLLLENIVKTSNQDCEGYVDIKNALSVMTGIAYHINDMKKRHENAVRVQEIQSLLYRWDGHDLTTYGELVAEGAFRMYRAKTLRHLFLFDKMLLIAKKKEEGILCYKTHIMCSNLMLIESIQGEPLCFHVIPFDNPREQHTFQARNAEQKREWCLQLKRVILENYNAVIPSHARQLVMELGQSKQEDSMALEKTSSKRQLSAPEYLEKRKQERRKSESSIRPFKIKKGPKKASGGERHSQQSLSASYDGSETSTKESTKPHGRWRRSSVDIIPGKFHRSSNETQGNFLTPSDADVAVSDSEKRSSIRFPFHFRGHDPDKGSSKRLQKSLPEETTDTENDDLLDVRPPPQTLSVFEGTGDQTDVGGEYVTFYFANSYAHRDQQHKTTTPVITVEDNCDDGYCTLSPNMFLADPTSSCYAGQLLGKVSDNSSYSSDHCNTSNIDMKISADYDNLVDLWTRLRSIQINCPEEDNASECSANSPALRRVHSFTGMKKQNCLSQSGEKNSRPSSFMRDSRILGSDDSVLNDCSLPTTSNVLNPSCWLSEHEDYVSDSSQKSVSLPWNFHIGNEKISVSVTQVTPPSSETESHQWMDETYPHVASLSHLNKATDQKEQSDDDLVIDLEKYIKNTRENKRNSCFPVTENELVTTAYENRASTLYDSTVRINSLNHKMHQLDIKSSSVKPMQCSVRSKLTSVKMPQGNANNECDENSNKASEILPIGTKLVQSLGKAYSAVMKQKPKGNKTGKASKSQILEKNNCLHKLGSSAIGARVAYPLDAEYCMLDNFLPLRKNKNEGNNTLRPDSLLSSSNITSSDSDRILSYCDRNFSCSSLPNCISNVAQEAFCASSVSSAHSKSTHSSIVSLSSHPETSFNSHRNQSDFMSNSNMAPPSSLPEFLSKDVGLDYCITSNDEPSVDSPSGGSDISGDSYYEKTFEAIENALVEEMFRDSAIYSEPDEIDLSSLIQEHVPHNMNDRNTVLDNGISETEKLPSHYDSVLNVTENYVVANRDESSSSVFQFPANDICSQPVNPKIINKLECLNQNCPNNVSDSPSLKGLKSIRERWKELEQWQNSNVNSEPSNVTAMKDFPENGINSNTASVDENNKPKGKGWVKHVVSKLQKEMS